MDSPFLKLRSQQLRTEQLEDQRNVLAEHVHVSCEFYMLIGPVIRSKLPEYESDPRINMDVCIDAMEKYGERLTEILKSDTEIRADDEMRFEGTE
jgi:hypothetical protein